MDRYTVELIETEVVDSYIGYISWRLEHPVMTMIDHSIILTECRFQDTSLTLTVI